MSKLLFYIASWPWQNGRLCLVSNRLRSFQVNKGHIFLKMVEIFQSKTFQVMSRMSNNSLFDGLSSNVGFWFWFHPTEYFHQKDLIPLLREPSFLKNRKGWLNSYIYRIRITSNWFYSQQFFMNILLVCLFRGEKKKKNKVMVESVRIFPSKNHFLVSPLPIIRSPLMHTKN